MTEALSAFVSPTINVADDGDTVMLLTGVAVTETWL